MMFQTILEIIGLTGTIIGIELIVALIFMFSFIYLRNQQSAAVLGSFSMMGMTFGLIAAFLKHDKLNN